MMSQRKIFDQRYFEPVTRQGQLPFLSVGLLLAYVYMFRLCIYVHVTIL